MNNDMTEQRYEVSTQRVGSGRLATYVPGLAGVALRDVDPTSTEAPAAFLADMAQPDVGLKNGGHHD